jgi:hypothetical protein
MPIAPCFNPATGASGGAPPATSASLYDIPFGDPIDITDGWTLYDPDNLIKSITFAGGFHTVIWNELLAGSQNYNWASGATHRAPRWYQPAQGCHSQGTTLVSARANRRGSVDLRRRCSEHVLHGHGQHHWDGTWSLRQLGVSLYLR